MVNQNVLRNNRPAPAGPAGPRRGASRGVRIRAAGCSRGIPRRAGYPTGTPGRNGPVAPAEHPRIGAKRRPTGQLPREIAARLRIRDCARSIPYRK